MSLSDLTAPIRRDEYTGENRCLPCTVLNAGIAVVVAVVVAAVGYPVVATIAFVGSLATIYLRGYLVPGTPTLTKRYLPPSVLRLFGKQPVSKPDRPNAADVDSVTETLVGSGVIDTRGASVRLDEHFEDEWHGRATAVRDGELDAESVRRLFDAEESTAQSDVSYVVGGDKLVRWESSAALVADVAAANLLSKRLDGWSELNRAERLDVLTGIRLFLERCPECDGPVSHSRRDVDSCCQRPFTVLQATCSDCNATLAEASVADPDDERPVRLQFLSG